MYPEAILNV